MYIQPRTHTTGYEANARVDESRGSLLSIQHAAAQTGRTLYSTAHKAYNAVDHYKMPHERARALRKALNQTSHLNQTPNNAMWSRAKSMDATLLNPDAFKNPIMRRLTTTASQLQEIGEGCADFSGITERVVKNLISAGNQNDMTRVIGSAVGRTASAYLSAVTFAANKIVGFACLTTSSLLSVAVLLLEKTSWGEKYDAQTLAQIRQTQKPRQGEVYSKVAAFLEKTKYKVLTRLTNTVSKHLWKLHPSMTRFSAYMRKNSNYAKNKTIDSRRADLDYMWKNPHQYGAFTNNMLKAAHFVFITVNKFLASYDKHIGLMLGRKIMRKTTGEILGTRIGMASMFAVAAVVSIASSGVWIGVTKLGLIACGIAVLMMLAAKAGVLFGGQWAGNCSPAPYGYF